MDQNQTLSEQISSAFQASSDGIATPEQEALRLAVLETVQKNINTPDILGVISQAVGTFSSVYDMEWAELQPIQKWVREESASADRAAPALRSMRAIYEALVTSDKNSGAGLSLGNGQNIIALDSEGRRWLIPRVSNDAVNQLTKLDDKKEIKNLLASTGATRFSWSIERPFLVPDPKDLAERLPLPAGGGYIFIYNGDASIITKSKFKRAFATFATECPVIDFLVWDRPNSEAAASLECPRRYWTPSWC